MSVLVGKVDCPRIRSTRLDQKAIATTASVKISRTNATNLPLQASLNDLKKGEPIVIFSSGGPTDPEVTAIYLLTGVEPILAAQPKGGEMNLGAWNMELGGGGGGEGGQ